MPTRVIRCSSNIYLEFPFLFKGWKMKPLWTFSRKEVLIWSRKANTCWSQCESVIVSSWAEATSWCQLSRALPGHLHKAPESSGEQHRARFVSHFGSSRFLETHKPVFSTFRSFVFDKQQKKGGVWGGLIPAVYIYILHIIIIIIIYILQGVWITDLAAWHIASFGLN